MTEPHQVKSEETVKLSSDIHHTPTHKTHWSTIPLFLACVLSVHVFKSRRYFGSCLPINMFGLLLCKCKSISLKFHCKLPDAAEVVASEQRQIQAITHPSELGQTKPLRTGYELGHSRRWCWEPKLCHRRDEGRGEQDGSSKLTDWTKPGSLLCYLITSCMSPHHFILPRSEERSHVQLVLTHTVESMDVIHRSLLLIALWFQGCLSV